MSRKRRTRTARKTHYTNLRHPFQPQKLFSDDEVAHLHEKALDVLETLGIKILLPEARHLLHKAGAKTAPDEMVHIGRDMVNAALKTAPTKIHFHGQTALRDLKIEPGALIFGPSGGCPNASDAIRGRRAGNLESYTEALQLHQSFHVIHMLGPCPEPQDVPNPLRHYAMVQAQLANSDKPLSVFARGRAQVDEIFQMIQIAMELDTDTFQKNPWCKTVINTNSPRQIDRPMAQGIIDFARAGQLAIMTPFCLAGAMAPITVAGALVLQHAEALAAITLSQIARPGAPVMYGAFGSNVDMKSGAPAFGTPTHFQMQLGSGQLARHINLPWRSAAGSASNTADMQAAYENGTGLWGAIQANATMILHSAGWLEGGLTMGYEKFINDIEALQIMAELTQKPDATDIGMDALAEVAPGGHFFATDHTMQRYDTAFYDPLVSDLSNHGTWEKAGAKTSSERATSIWQDILKNFKPPKGADARAARIDQYIADRTKAGGAAPMD